MNYNEFRNLPEIKKRDHEPDDKGIFITEKNLPEIPHNISNTKPTATKEEIAAALTNFLPGLESTIINEYAEEALHQNLELSDLKDFAQKKSGLKLETMDTGAIPNEKTTTKDSSFIPQAKTPTVPQTTHPKDKSGDLTNEGPEI